MGRHRECMAANGSVHQKITVWEPLSRLEFRMVRTTLVRRWFVASMVEEFRLAAASDGATRVTRSTTGRIKACLLFAPLVKLGLKEVHRYIFRNCVTV